MTFQYRSHGQADVASYLMTGLPWVSSSTVPSGSVWRIQFPYVTNEITVRMASPLGASTNITSVGIGFTQNGVQSNKNMFIIQSNGTNYSEEIKVKIRTKELYIVGLTGTSKVSVMAGLTLISSSSFPVLTGSADTNAYQFGYDGLG